MAAVAMKEDVDEESSSSDESYDELGFLCHSDYVWDPEVAIEDATDFSQYLHVNCNNDSR